MMLQRKCLNDVCCVWKKSWHTCCTASTITPVSPDQHLNPRKTKRKGTCRNRFCWVRITQQHRVLTRNNCLRRKPSTSSPPTSTSKSQCDPAFHRRLYKSRRRSLHHLHFIDDGSDHNCQDHNQQRSVEGITHQHQQQQQHQHQQPMVLQNAWTPPITAETLQELCVDQITSNIQLRHDLLFDRNLRFRPNFDGTSGKAKQRKAERYWARLDRAFQHQYQYASDYDAFLPVILEQVVESLALLHHSEKWPSHITMDTVRSMLNPDLILRELANNKLDLKSRVRFVVSVLQPMCPVEYHPRIQLLVLYFSQKCYAKAFRQCFATLEAIQLDHANQFLREKRNYLIQTCAQYEQQWFFQNSKGDHDKRAAIELWLASSRDHPDWSFLKVYHTALIRLITMDHTPFPHTLQYDRQRLVHQFRAEFIYITTLAILLIPYYYLVGKWWNETDLHSLKLKLAQRLKRAGQQQQHNYSQYQYFAIYACEAAMTTHARYENKKKHTNKKHHLQLENPRTVLWWAEWLKRHMNASSEIYKIMHDRVFHVLKRVSQGQLQQHDFNSNTLKPLDREILALGLRIRAVADLNLATYGTLYHQVWYKMTNSFKL